MTASQFMNNLMRFHDSYKKYAEELGENTSLSYFVSTCNPDFDMSYVNKFPDFTWNWKALSLNPRLDMKFVEKYSNKPWDWYNLGDHPNFDKKLIHKFPNKPWNRFKFYKELKAIKTKELKSNRKNT